MMNSEVMSETKARVLGAGAALFTILAIAEVVSFYPGDQEAATKQYVQECASAAKLNPQQGIMRNVPTACANLMRFFPPVQADGQPLSGANSGSPADYVHERPSLAAYKDDTKDLSDDAKNQALFAGSIVTFGFSAGLGWFAYDRSRRMISLAKKPVAVAS